MYKSQKGFMQLEAAAAVFIAVLLAAAVSGGADNYMRHQYKQQVMTAADLFAADLRQLQQQALFTDGILNRQIKATTAGDGYAFYKDRKIIKRIYFTERNCDGVYFSQKTGEAQYSNMGSPSKNVDFVLRHKNLADFSCKIEVQPVTGRVVVSEGK